MSLLIDPEFEEEQLRKERQVAEALLGLPKLRLLTCPEDDYDRKRDSAVESIVGLEKAKWRRLYSQGNSVVYRRVREPTDGD